jgi:exodeoxyribonuclease VII small subunit
MGAMSDEQSQPLPAFEASLEELERVVKELERGELPLEKSLEFFERGMKLSADCRKQLEDAEMKVEILLKKGTKTVAMPFDPGPENAANQE